MRGFGQESVIWVKQYGMLKKMTVRDACFHELQDFYIDGRVGQDDGLVQANTVDIVGVETDAVRLFTYQFTNGLQIRCTGYLEVLSDAGVWIPLRELDYETHIVTKSGITTLDRVISDKADFIFEVFADGNPIYVNDICVKSGRKKR